VSHQFGAFTFHADRRQLLRNGLEVHLTPKAFDLLALLIERHPAVVSKPDIHTRLWPDTFVSDATLVGLVKELRRALSDDHQGAIIRTAHRVGYAFAGAAHVAPPARSAPAVTCWLETAGRRLPLCDGINVIGRDPDSTIWLDVAGVSRLHARVVVDGGTASIADLGSKNGTLVGGRLVREPVVLADADRIQVASEILVFHVSSRGMPTLTQPVTPAHRARNDPT